MKAIILAGGSGTRLRPLTLAVSKQLMPIYDKPMIYYPIYTLVSAGIKDILIITTPRDQTAFKNLLGNGKQWGIKLHYKVQKDPKGIVDAFSIGANFIKNHQTVLILGDNLFYGDNLSNLLKKALTDTKNTTIFGYPVKDPKRYGIVEFNSRGQAQKITEKPQHPRSNYAIPGLYVFPSDVVTHAQTVQPSARGELEITSLLNIYLKQHRLNVVKFNRSTKWFDTGTHDALLEAANFVQKTEQKLGHKICSLDS